MKPPNPGYQTMRRRNDARECLRKRLLEPGHTPATPRNQPHIARGSAAAGRCLREREGRFASFLTPAPSGTDLPPLATQHAGKIGSRFQSVEGGHPTLHRFDERSASPDSLFSLLWIRRSRWLEYAVRPHRQASSARIAVEQDGHRAGADIDPPDETEQGACRGTIIVTAGTQPV